MSKALRNRTAVVVSAVAERPGVAVPLVVSGLLGLLVLILAIARLGAA